jgi:hypothetical protein
LEQSNYERLLNVRPSTPIFHYTSHVHLKSILETGIIWATSIVHLNDSSEFYHAIDSAEKIIKETNPSKELGHRTGQSYKDEVLSLLLMLNNDRHKLLPYYISCFSEDGNSLDLWRAYCHEGSGYSIGYDWNENKDDTLIIGKCIYDDAEKESLINERFNHFSSINIEKLKPKVELLKSLYSINLTNENKIRAFSFYIDLMEYSVLFKDSAFESEAEYRIIKFSSTEKKSDLKFRAGNHLLIPYKEIPLTEGNVFSISCINIGPTNHPALSKHSLHAFIESYNVSNETSFKIKCKDIQISHIPLRTI